MLPPGPRHHWWDWALITSRGRFRGNLAADAALLRVNGSIMIYASNGDREPKLPVRDLTAKNLHRLLDVLAGVPHSDRKRRRPTSPRGRDAWPHPFRWPRAFSALQNGRAHKAVRLAARLAPLSSTAALK